MHKNFKEMVALWLRRIISYEAVRKAAKLFHVNQIGKKVYFAVFAPDGKKISHVMDGISAQFYVKNYTDLIYLTETAVGAGDERQVIKVLLENLKPGDVVFDIGAFLGLLTIFFAKKIGPEGKVIAVEPSLQSYRALQDNVALNEVDNVIAMNVALGSELKEAVLKGNDSSMYSLSEQFGIPAFEQKTTIVPGDQLIKAKNLPFPHVVKIDVEGYEYSVVKGMENSLKSDTCRLVCCEVHPTLLPSSVTPEMLLDLFRSFGFTCIETYGRGSTFHAFCYKE